MNSKGVLNLEPLVLIFCFKLGKPETLYQYLLGTAFWVKLMAAKDNRVV